MINSDFHYTNLKTVSYTSSPLLCLEHLFVFYTLGLTFFFFCLPPIGGGILETNIVDTQCYINLKCTTVISLYILSLQV